MRDGPSSGLYRAKWTSLSDSRSSNGGRQSGSLIRRGLLHGSTGRAECLSTSQVTTLRADERQFANDHFRAADLAGEVLVDHEQLYATCNAAGGKEINSSAVLAM